MILCSILASLILQIPRTQFLFIQLHTSSSSLWNISLSWLNLLLSIFYAVVDGIDFLISFSNGLLLVHTTDFCMLTVLFYNFCELVLTIVCMPACIYVYAFVYV